MSASKASEPVQLPAVKDSEWLSPKELAAQFGLSQYSAYRWVNEGLIPQTAVQYCGTWRIRIHPGVIPYLQVHFRKAHER